MEQKKFVIVWCEYFYDEDFIEPEDGGHTWADDHYEEFDTMEEAEKALPKFQELDEDAHIIVMD